MNNDPKELLRACAENLLNAVTRLEGPSSTSQVPVSATAGPLSGLTSQSSEVSQCSSLLTSSMVSSAATLKPKGSAQVNKPSAAEEHRKLFGYRPPASSRSMRPPQPKRRRTTGNQVLVPVRNTWSRVFVCLLKKNATTASSAAEKVQMALAGLDEKTICFTKGRNSEHVHQKILEAFPMLSDVGGYQILRTGERGNRELLLIDIPPGGYTVAYLKSTIASAKGYIRPFQKDIVINESTVINQGQAQV